MLEIRVIQSSSWEDTDKCSSVCIKILCLIYVSFKNKVCKISKIFCHISTIHRICFLEVTTNDSWWTVNDNACISTNCETQFIDGASTKWHVNGFPRNLLTFLKTIKLRYTGSTSFCISTRGQTQETGSGVAKRCQYLHFDVVSSSQKLWCLSHWHEVIIRYVNINLLDYHKNVKWQFK